MKSASGGWLLYKATGMICTLIVLHYNADSFVNAISFVYVHFNRLASKHNETFVLNIRLYDRVKIV